VEHYARMRELERLDVGMTIAPTEVQVKLFEPTVSHGVCANLVAKHHGIP
jgi:hypothetical protein